MLDKPLRLIGLLLAAVLITHVVVTILLAPDLGTAMETLQGDVEQAVHALEQLVADIVSETTNPATPTADGACPSGDDCPPEASSR